MVTCKVVNLTTNRCVRIIGKEESVRFLHLALHQGQIGKAATHSVVRANHLPPLVVSLTHCVCRVRKWRCQTILLSDVTHPTLLSSVLHTARTGSTFLPDVSRRTARSKDGVVWHSYLPSG